MQNGTNQNNQNVAPISTPNRNEKNNRKILFALGMSLIHAHEYSQILLSFSLSLCNAVVVFACVRLSPISGDKVHSTLAWFAQIWHNLSMIYSKNTVLYSHHRSLRSISIWTSKWCDESDFAKTTTISWHQSRDDFIELNLFGNNSFTHSHPSLHSHESHIVLMGRVDILQFMLLIRTMSQYIDMPLLIRSIKNEESFGVWIKKRCATQLRRKIFKMYAGVWLSEWVTYFMSSKLMTGCSIKMNVINDVDDSKEEEE